MNRLLKRQIKRYFKGIENVPDELLPFLEAVERSYKHYEDDRVLLERAMELSSEELVEANQYLRRESEEQKAVLKKLKSTLKTVLSISPEEETEDEKLKDDEDMLRIVTVLEEKLRQVKVYEEKLLAVNNELEDFAYIISHDLKAPLRGISTLTNWLIEDYKSDLDEEGQELVVLLNKRVGRMHGLIDGVLKYSRVGRQKIVRTNLNLDEIVVDVIDTLSPPENISVSITSEMPIIQNDETQIRQLFQNFISNAIKYNDKSEGIVEINCEDLDTHWEFCVSDNGPGINPKYHEKVFLMFQTLHKKDEFESTGIGLTIVSKIINQNNGKIRIDSEEGRGAKFYFSIQKLKDDTNG
jgi:light-regulated signal transduction histidine kinase (bacteriophytochrome)